ncbi:uncharacterized protein LOC144180102 [Haemaphysalis longicornis]
MAEGLQIVTLSEAGFQDQDIADATGHARSSINRIVRSYKTECRLENLPRGHRPRATNDSDDDRIVAAARQDPKLTAKAIRNDLRLAASTQVIRSTPPYIQRVASSGRCGVRVWGAISKDGLGPLVRLDGRFNAAIYKDLLDTIMLPLYLFYTGKYRQPKCKFRSGDDAVEHVVGLGDRTLGLVPAPVLNP